MSDRRADILEAFDRHEAFTVAGQNVVVEPTPFDLRLTVAVEGDRARYELAATLPSLEAVVVGDRVADVVLEGWADTLDRRLREAHDVTGELTDIAYETTWDRDRFRAVMTVERPATAPAPTDGIVALANYVEGTYLQGVIPGYDYGPPVDQLLSQARQRAGEEEPTPPGERSEQGNGPSPPPGA